MYRIVSPSRTSKPSSLTHSPYGRGQGEGRVTARDEKIPLGYRPPEFCLLHATLPATPLPARPRRATVSPTGSVGRWATCHRHVAAPKGGGRISPAGSGPGCAPVGRIQDRRSWQRRPVRGRAPLALAHPSSRGLSPKATGGVRVKLHFVQLARPSFASAKLAAR